MRVHRVADDRRDREVETTLEEAVNRRRYDAEGHSGARDRSERQHADRVGESNASGSDARGRAIDNTELTGEIR